MTKPVVSIVVPCYKQAQYLDEALQSVLDQSFSNWECIIVNDGSPDGTEEVTQKWLAKDNRFIYLKKNNGGLSSARNAGINIAKGEFILPLDADDKIAPNYVTLAIKSFKEDLLLKVVYCKAEKFGSESGPWQLSPFSIYDLCQFNMVFCSALYRKKDWEVVGGYDINMIYGLEDWEFWISVLKNGGKVKRLEKVGFYYRIKDISMLKQLNNEKNSYSMEYMSIKHADFFVKQIGSFTQLKNTIKQSTEVIRKNNEKLKDKKFVIDIFCKTFFGFTFFGKYKNDI